MEIKYPDKIRTNISKKVIIILFFSVIFGSSTFRTVSSMQTSSQITATGTIINWPRVDISVNVNEVIGVNNLSLGFQLDWDNWKKFLDRPIQRQLAQDAGFKLIRIFDFRSTTPRLMPCTYWNEETKTGTWNWANVDSLTQKIFEVGAEPLFCLGYARTNIQNYIPPGMTVNSTTQLPYPDSYAAYAAEWVKHFYQLGLPVRFYEIMNEPHAYFGWNGADTAKLRYFTELWNICARAMKAQDARILLSFDTITHKNILEHWVTNGDNVDYLDFHKYDAATVGEYSDQVMFSRAETRYITTSATLHGIDEARQIWYNGRGKWLPVINSESNFNSATPDNDPKIQQMTGAVWLALVLRTGIIKGINYNVYFHFSSSKSYEETHGTGWGFGMINEDVDHPWFPYYVNQFFSNNLGVGDNIRETGSSTEDFRVIAWTHGNQLNTLIISKVNEKRTVHLIGIEGNLNIFLIDNTVPSDNPSVKSGTFNTSQPLITNGYAVILLQTP